MYTIRSGWGVQTFALGKCNESEGRKSRIRRSKEERKAMVESYIKKYQSTNNGNFPSLNLTHKEVGGSFYTIREIVREVIQENRVLGPAKLTPEEVKAWNANQLSEQYPLGSISYEPQIPLVSSPNGTHFGPDHESTSGKVIITTNGKIINESQMEIKGEEAEYVKCLELQASDPSEAKKIFEEEMVASTAKTNLPEVGSSEAKENLEEKTVWPIAKVDLPEIEASEAKENLEEKTVWPIAKVDLPEIVTSEAKENLEEKTVWPIAKVDLPEIVPSEAKEHLEEKTVLPMAKVNLPEIVPSEAKENLKEKTVLPIAKVDLPEIVPSEAKEHLEEKIVLPMAKVDLPEIVPSEAKENLKEKTVPSIAKVDLPEIVPSKAKDHLEEKIVLPIAKVDLPEIVPSEAKENVEEDMVASRAALDSLVTEPLEVKEKSEEKLHAPKIEVNPLPAELIVETFPFRPANKSSDSLDARLGEVRVSTSSFEKTEAEEGKLGSPDISSISSLYKSVLVGKDEEKEAGVHNSQSDTNVETYEPHNNEALAFHNDKTEANDQSQTGAQVKAVNVLNGASTKYPKGVSNKAEVKPSGSSKKGNNPTMDRVNLESREGPSRASPRQDKNPLLAIFKLFITAFMKFWSE